MKRRKNISAALICCLAVAQAACLTGCGEEPAAADEEVIGLIEPTAELSGSEVVRRRDLYMAKTYEVLVDPYIEDYTYEETRNFLPTGRKIGDMVAAGEIIYQADILSQAPQMEKLMEKLNKLQEDYAEYYYDMMTEINDQRWELKKLGERLEEIQDDEPDDESSAAHAAWDREETRATGEYNKKELDIIMNEAALKEKEELLFLDYEYYARQVQELQLQNQLGDVRSNINGQIIYLNMCDEGDTISPGTVVASVADMNQKRIVCRAVDRAARNAIQEAYAFFNGKKYEVVCDEEASDLISTVFLLQDPKGEVPVGTYGNLVFYTGVRRQVLTVPKEAVHNVGLEKYAYVLEGGRTVVRTVKIGLSDGVYVEILSGLEEGERVFLDRSDPQAVHTAVLERGSVSMQYLEKGILYYPIKFWIECDVEHGTIVFDSWQPYVSEIGGTTYTFDRLSDALNMPMRAGDVIANINVVPSDVEKQELVQLESQLKRAEERLADLVKKDAEGSEKLIESRQEEIQKMREQLVELTADYSVTTVRTERNGRLEYVYDSVAQYDGKTITRYSVLKGDKMSAYYDYARLADTSMAYLLLPEKNSDAYKNLGYNTKLTISYNNWQNETVTKEVPLVRADMTAEGKNYTQALYLDQEILEDLNAYNSQQPRIYSNRQASLSVKGTVMAMDNVILLPEEAIKLVNSSFGYVNVLMEDGSICPTSVVIGKKYPNEDRGYSYCVIEGLTEGMTICWE